MATIEKKKKPTAIAIDLKHNAGNTPTTKIKGVRVTPPKTIKKKIP